MDWLVFMGSFYGSQKSFKAAENLARLSVTLKGVAREPVYMMLATAVEPSVVMRWSWTGVLDTRSVPRRTRPA